MKKLFISVLFIGGFAAYAFYNYSQTQSASASANQSASAAVTAPVTTNNSSNSASAVPVSNTTSSASAPPLVASQTTTTVTKSTTTATPVTTTVKTSSGEYVDGTYTGSVEDAYYGNVQVEAIISGGRLSNVVFLQSPNDRSTSISINKRAMPTLIAEAVKAQSANVNGVSGASDTSTAFEQSLASALSAAKA
jgi:uncharacterized protein with FMN-binding domain